MQSGLLWFDNSPAPLVQKIEGAIKRYVSKFGAQPNRCFVNPRALGPIADVEFPILIGAKITIMPNYFWLGVDESIISGAETDGSTAGADSSCLPLAIADNTPRVKERYEHFIPCANGNHAECSAGYRGILDNQPYVCDCACHSGDELNGTDALDSRPTDDELHENTILSSTVARDD